jgi:hypothetical protein
MVINHIENKFGGIIPDHFTRSFKKFRDELGYSELFIVMVSIGGDFILENKDQVKKRLIELYQDPGNNLHDEIVESIRSGEVDKIFDLSTYQNFYGQMAYARTMDNVLTYFKEILAEVIIKKPEILKSRETERLDFILNYNSIEELQIALAEKKIETLFYAGIDKIESYFKERLGIELFKNKEDKIEFNQAIKNRNLIVHNRGVISKEYVKEFPDYKKDIGLIIQFDYESLSRVNLILQNFVVYLDKELATKFSLDLIDNKS